MKEKCSEIFCCCCCNRWRCLNFLGTVLQRRFALKSVRCVCVRVCVREWVRKKERVREREAHMCNGKFQASLIFFLQCFPTPESFAGFSRCQKVLELTWQDKKPFQRKDLVKKGKLTIKISWIIGISNQPGLKPRTLWYFSYTDDQCVN